MSEPRDLRLARENGTLHVAGDLDLATTPAFAEGVRSAAADGAHRLDLSRVVFIDSSGLRALVELVREAPELTLAPAVSRAVHRLLDMTGMLDALPFEAPPIQED